MKKVIVLLIASLVVFASYSPSEARRHHRNNNDSAEALAGFIVGTVFGTVITGGGYGYHNRSGYYNYDQERRAAMQRARRHEQTIQRYENCLAERRVDIYYGVPPEHAKDCSRYHPANRNWNY